MMYKQFGERFLMEINFCGNMTFFSSIILSEEMQSKKFFIFYK